jgi:hypothetical protein
MALMLSAVPPNSFQQHLIQDELPGAKILIDLCSTGAISSPSVEPFSYLDELGQLFSGIPHKELSTLLTSRFDELEDVGLDALFIGGGSYFISWDSPYAS